MVPLDIRVIYGDTDQMGVVYYANYLRYFEAGRGEFLRAHGRNYLDIEAAASACRWSRRASATGPRPVTTT